MVDLLLGSGLSGFACDDKFQCLDMAEGSSAYSYSVAFQSAQTRARDKERSLRRVDIYVQKGVECALDHLHRARKQARAGSAERPHASRAKPAPTPTEPQPGGPGPPTDDPSESVTRADFPLLEVVMEEEKGEGQAPGDAQLHLRNARLQFDAVAQFAVPLLLLQHRQRGAAGSSAARPGQSKTGLSPSLSSPLLTQPDHEAGQEASGVPAGLDESSSSGDSMMDLDDVDQLLRSLSQASDEMSARIEARKRSRSDADTLQRNMDGAASSGDDETATAQLESSSGQVDLRGQPSPNQEIYAGLEEALKRAQQQLGFLPKPLEGELDLVLPGLLGLGAGSSGSSVREQADGSSARNLPYIHDDHFSVGKATSSRQYRSLSADTQGQNGQAQLDDEPGVWTPHQVAQLVETCMLLNNAFAQSQRSLEQIQSKGAFSQQSEAILRRQLKHARVLQEAAKRRAGHAYRVVRRMERQRTQLQDKLKQAEQATLDATRKAAYYKNIIIQHHISTRGSSPSPKSRSRRSHGRSPSSSLSSSRSPGSSISLARSDDCPGSKSPSKNSNRKKKKQTPPPAKPPAKFTPKSFLTSLHMFMGGIVLLMATWKRIIMWLTSKFSGVFFRGAAPGAARVLRFRG